MSWWRDYTKSPDGLAEYEADAKRYMHEREQSGAVDITERAAPTDGVWVQMDTDRYYAAGTTAEHYEVANAIVRALHCDGWITGEIRVVRFEGGIPVQWWEA